MRFDGFLVWKAQWEKHRDGLLAATAAFTELCDKVFLLLQEPDPSGIGMNQARMGTMSHKGLWDLSNMKPLKIALSNCFLAERGYLGLLDQSQALDKTA